MEFRFDQLMLLADGRIIYMNDANRAVDFFARQGYRCPTQNNPADYFMIMMSIEAYDYDAEDEEELTKRKTEIEIDYKKKITEFHNNYENSELRCNPDQIHPEIRPVKKEDEHSYRANFLKQFWLLLERSFRNIIRNPMTSTERIVSTVIISVLLVLIYGQIGHDEQSIQTRSGVLFFVTI